MTVTLLQKDVFDISSAETVQFNLRTTFPCIFIKIHQKYSRGCKTKSVIIQSPVAVIAQRFYRARKK